MAVRTRAVHPDQEYRLADGTVILAVSEEALLEAVVDVTRTAFFAGGIVQVVQDRHPTGVPHEMVTVGAVVQWQDRTDAKPQPEPATPAHRVEPEQDIDGAFRPEPTTAELNIQRHEEEYGRIAQQEGRTLLPVDPEPEELEAALEHEEGRAAAAAALAEREPVVVGAPPSVARERTDGAGSAALPFQRGHTEPQPPPADAPALADIVRGSGVPDPQTVPKPGKAADFAFDDGLRVDENAEDDSEVPERFR